MTDNQVLETERLAIVSLWSVPGIGPRAMATIKDLFQGEYAQALRVPVSEWSGALKLSPSVRQFLSGVDRIGDLGERTMEQAKSAGIGIAFPGDRAFPANLVGLVDGPPLLFHQGSPGSPRRLVAMVGSRHPDQGFLAYAQDFARRVAERGVGIVSGAAEGVDRACHFGAFEAGGETWAFLGSALDELDPAQAALLPHFLEHGGTFYSELPPGVRASSASFPRRNRLISGAADAVLVLRAAEESGALYTAKAATDQNRPLLALPGESSNPAARGCNELIQSGQARLCLGPEDVWAAAGINPSTAAAQASGDAAVEMNELSAEARRAYRSLGRPVQSFDELVGSSGLASGALVSALCELELMGLVVQHPGKRYEKI
jgi:DNA protecting protein DprA